jgi:tetratricopeptide (TPR) repeat protein
VVDSAKPGRAPDPIDALTGRVAARSAILDNLLRHAETYAAHGDLRRALVAAEFAARLDPRSGAAAAAVVRALRLKGDLDRAAQVLHGTLEVIGESVELKSEQGWLAYAGRQWDEAGEIFRALLSETVDATNSGTTQVELRKGLAGTLYGLGWKAYRQHEFERAAALFAEADRNWGDVDVRLSQVLALHASDKTDDARTLFESLTAEAEAKDSARPEENAPGRREILESLLRHVRESTAEDDLDAALVAAQYAVRLHPPSDLAAAALVGSLRLRSDLEHAEDTLQGSLEIFPESPALELERACLAHDQGDYEQAGQIFEGLLADRPTLADAWQALVACRRAQRRFDEAQGALQRASEALARIPPALAVEEGWLAFDQGDYDQAGHIFERLVADRPAFGDAWQALVACRRAQRRFDEAQAALQRASEALAGTAPGLTLEEGWLAYDQGDFRRSDEIFGQLSTDHPQEIEAWIGRVRSLCAQARFAEAAALVNERRREDHVDPLVQMEWARVAYHQRNWKEAEATSRRLAESWPTLLEAWTYWMASLRMDGRVDDAERALELARRHFAKDEPSLLLEQGWIAFERENYDAAYRIFRSAVRARRSAPAASAAILSLRKAGRLELAERRLEDLASELGEPYELVLQRAEILYEKGFYYESRQAFAEALAHVPNSSAAASGLINCMWRLGWLEEVGRPAPPTDPPSRPPIFRESALAAYRRGMSKDVLPRLTSRPLIVCSWLLIATFITAAVLAWSVRVPIYLTAAGMILEQQDADPADGGRLAALFLPPDQSARVHVGQPVRAQITSPEIYVNGTVAQIEGSPINANAAAQYGLAGDHQVVGHPTGVVIVRFGGTMPPTIVDRTRLTAQVQIGSQRILALVPGLGGLFGGAT